MDRDSLYDLYEGSWIGIPYTISRRVYEYGFPIRPLDGLWIGIPHTISRRVYGYGLLIRFLGRFMDSDSLYDL